MVDAPVWRRLTPSSRAAFEFAAGAVAAAGEPGLQEWGVDSGALLVGIVRAHQDQRRPSAAEDLLTHAGRAVTELEQALWAEREHEEPFEPATRDRVRLDDLPPLGEHGGRVLDEAIALADEQPTRDGSVPLSYLFGGLLRAGDSVAVRALAQVVGAELLRGATETYSEYVRFGDTARYLDFLASRFPRETSPEPPPPRPRPRAGNDLVGETDGLGFADYVAAFADLIESPETEPPLTIGIFGSWGMGKSFLLRHIERELLERQEQRRRAAEAGVAAQPAARVHVVGFNAWEYSAAEVIWPGLVRKVMDRLEAEVDWGRFGRLAIRLRRNLRRELRRDPATLLATVVVAAAALVVGLWRGGWSFALLGLSLLGVAKIATDVLANPLSRWVVRLFEDSSYGRAIGTMEEIEADLRDLGHRLHQDERILILIDDLDRCEPEKAVEVLQAINLLLNFDRFVVVLGIDARVVTRAIERHYDGVLDRAGATGFEYLEKVVQIPFRIPEPEHGVVSAFLGAQLGSVGAAEGKNGSAPTETTSGESAPAPADATDAPAPVEIPEFTEAEIAAFQELAPYLRPNPRHLKRLVNVYRLVRTLAERRADPVVLDDPRRTIRWLVLCGQWPYTARAMLGQLDAMEDANDPLLRDAKDVDPLRHLLAAAAPTLATEARRKLDDDAERLDDLIALEGARFTWHELVTIRGYTINFNPAVDSELADLALPAEPEEEEAEPDGVWA